MSQIKWVTNCIAAADLTSSASSFYYTYQPAVQGENADMMIIRQITATIPPSDTVAGTGTSQFTFYVFCDINQQNIGYISMPYTNVAADTNSTCDVFNSNPCTHVMVNKSISNAIKFQIIPITSAGSTVPTSFSLAIVFDMIKYFDD